MQSTFKVNSTRRSLEFISLISVLLCLQAWRVTNIAPLPESIWDNIYLWDWARSFSYGDFSGFLNDSHHQSRWGVWLPAAVLIDVFSDHILVYYLTTIVPSTLAIAIFTYLIYREVGLLAGLVFLCLWFFDALLFRATFQLLPSGQGLLPIALLFWICLDIVKNGECTIRSVLFAALVTFWLYGTKETHLAFLPAVAWIVFRFGSRNLLLIFFGILLAGYALETVFFNYISEEYSWLGRVYHLINDGQHIKIMTENARYVGQQTRFFDSGLTMRWVSTSGITPVVIFLSYFLAAQTLLNSQFDQQEYLAGSLKVASIFVISFLIFTTFFVVSLSPLRLGHTNVPRYATLLLPFCYFLIIGYAATVVRRQQNSQKKVGRWKAVFTFLVMVPFLVAPAIDRYLNYKARNIFQVSKNYAKWGGLLKKYECVRSTNLAILSNSLDMIPMSSRDPRIHRMATEEELITKVENVKARILFRKLYQRATEHTQLRH